MDVPLPAGLEWPLPDLLTHGEAVCLLKRWGFGGKHYLKKLVTAGRLTVSTPPLQAHGRYVAAEMVGIYRECVESRNGKEKGIGNH